MNTCYFYDIVDICGILRYCVTSCGGLGLFWCIVFLGLRVMG